MFGINFSYLIFDSQFFRLLRPCTVHMVIFGNFVKSMTSCLLHFKITPNFYFPNVIPDNVTETNTYNRHVLSCIYLICCCWMICWPCCCFMSCCSWKICCCFCWISCDSAFRWESTSSFIGYKVIYIRCALIITYSTWIYLFSALTG
jgi:hypothetical protein